MSSHTMLRTPELIQGFGCLRELGPLLDKIGAQCILVVSSRELEDLGLLQKCLDALHENPSRQVVVMAEVLPDPDLETVEKICALGRKQGTEFLIALGGGSPIDAAKAAAAILANDSDFDRLIQAQNLRHALPILAIPTTAGTGSELTPVAIITDTRDKIKKGLVSEALIPRYALLDAELTLGLPQPQTAYTGLDAFSHALEACFSLGAHELTDFYAERALVLVRDNLLKVYRDGQNRQAREAMQLAAYYAGIAFANAGVTAAHAFAYPLGARYHLPHGLLVSLMLPAVVEYSWQAKPEKARHLARLLTAREDAEGEDLIAFIVQLIRNLGLQMGLSYYGVQDTEIEEMAESVLGITRLLKNNPRPISTREESRQIYKRAYSFQ